MTTLSGFLFNGTMTEEKQKLLTKAQRYQLHHPIDKDWKEVGAEIRELQKQGAELMNRVMTEYYIWHYQLYSTYYLCNGRNLTEFFNKIKTEQNKNNPLFKLPDAYIIGKNYIGNDYKMSTAILSQIVQKARKKFLDEWKDVIIYQNKSLSTFKNSFPLQIHPSQIQLEKDEDDFYNVSLGLYGTNIDKEKRWIKFSLYNPDGFRKVEIDRIISGEYKLCASQLQFNEKSRKWELIISYKFQQKEKKLDSSIYCGVDTGIMPPAYCALNNSFARLTFEGLYNRLIRFHRRTNAIRRQIQHGGKKIYDSRSGHGRNNKLKPISDIRNNIKQFRKNINHFISKSVIDFCIENNAGTIVLENLSGIKQEKQDLYYKAWPIYELHSFIKYKAKENGINVKIVNPRYTSQRCHKCGYIHPDNRDKKKFKCLKCSNECHADYNAAKNLSNPDIEELIDVFVKFKENTKDDSFARQSELFVFA